MRHKVDDGLAVLGDDKALAGLRDLIHQGWRPILVGVLGDLGQPCARGDERAGLDLAEEGIIQVKLPFEGTIGHPPAALEQGNRLIEDLFLRSLNFIFGRLFQVLKIVGI